MYSYALIHNHIVLNAKTNLATKTCIFFETKDQC